MRRAGKVRRRVPPVPDFVARRERSLCPLRPLHIADRNPSDALVVFR